MCVCVCAVCVDNQSGQHVTNRNKSKPEEKDIDVNNKLRSRNTHTDKDRNWMHPFSTVFHCPTDRSDTTIKCLTDPKTKSVGLSCETESDVFWFVFFFLELE